MTGGINIGMKNDSVSHPLMHSTSVVVIIASTVLITLMLPSLGTRTQAAEKTSNEAVPQPQNIKVTSPTAETSASGVKIDCSSKMTPKCLVRLMERMAENPLKDFPPVTRSVLRSLSKSEVAKAQITIDEFSKGLDTLTEITEVSVLQETVKSLVLELAEGGDIQRAHNVVKHVLCCIFEAGTRAIALITMADIKSNRGDKNGALKELSQAEELLQSEPGLYHGVVTLIVKAQYRHRGYLAALSTIRTLKGRDEADRQRFFVAITEAQAQAGEIINALETRKKIT